MDTERILSTLDEVRLAIYRHHTQLAQLLDELEVHANAVIAGGDDIAALHGALGTLQTRLFRHIDFEEAQLPKWLRAAGPAAAETARALLEDHPEQRRKMDGLIHDRAVFSDGKVLAREALTFAHVLRKDIEKEEKALRAMA